ncbi:AIPR family protein [Prescottella equi]|uniref:AIPR family protein n=1 Tax=Rhodococcus hoagii TaxID=43767 RepID=UPI00191C7B28|nr:AIPR family protein [Prescottella equi]
MAAAAKMDPLIKGLLNNFRKEYELLEMDEADSFELFIAFNLFRDDILDQVELTDLLLDENVIGVDLALLEVNGAIVNGPGDVDEICSRSKSLEVRLELAQVKRPPHVDTSEILSFGDIAENILNNSISDKHPRLAAISKAFQSIFENYAARLKEKPNVSLTFVTTASNQSVNDETVINRAETVRSRLADISFIGDVTFDIWGATKVYEAHQRRTNANETTVVFEKVTNLPEMPGVDQALLGVVSVEELLKLIENEGGSLNEGIFYENVRGFKGEDNAVNKQIGETLRSESRALLPVLNNGVTVVSRSYAPQPGDKYSLSGYQVVNGCQTSHCIHLAKADLDGSLKSVFVPIKIVVTKDDGIATEIIRATNSQTAVTDADLIALTKFQKRLEDYYSVDNMGIGLKYERRSGQFFFNQVTRTRIVTITEQMRAVAATFLDQPHVAARYPKDLYSEVGESIFDDSHLLAPYAASAYAAYRLETAFRTSLEPEFKQIRYHILMAYKYVILDGKSAELNKTSIESNSKKIVDSLKGNNYVSKFRETAHIVVEAAGGDIPTRDRLKRQQFTQELKTHFASKVLSAQKS